MNAPAPGLLQLTQLLTFTHAGVVTRISGPQHAEISRGSNVHVYITRGTDIGTPFAPPSIRVGVGGTAVCEVQGFTSSHTRLHCIISADGLPAPRPSYGSRVEQYMPLWAECF